MKVIERVRQGLVQFGSVNDEDLRALKDVYARYSDSDILLPTLAQALAVSEDWQLLARVISRKPLERRTQQDHVMLVQSYLKLGRYKEANEVLLPLIEHNADNVELRVLAAHAYLFQNEYERAARLLDEVWEKALAENNAEACLVRGQIYFYEGDDQLARETIDTGLHMDGVSAAMRIRLHNALGRVLAAMGDMEAARAHATRSSELYAAISEREHRMMRLSAKSQDLNRAMAAGEFDTCERIIHEMLEIADPPIQAYLYQNLAQVYMQMGREDEARDAMQRAHEISGNSN